MSGAFHRDGYIKVENVIPKDMCKIFTQYALFDMLGDFTIEDNSPQVPNTHSVYGDYLMESLLLYVKPIVEKNTGLELIPTYSYYRVYKPGDVLEKHVDRFACEVSTTLTLGFNYRTLPSDYRWGISFHDDNDNKKTIYTDPGEMVIYKGCDLIHSRGAMEGAENSYHVQVFLHYVDAHGNNTEEKYDARPAIGTMKKREMAGPEHPLTKGYKLPPKSYNINK